MKAVFDTNILIDYLNGIDAAKKEIERFDIKAISIITYIETLVGIGDSADEIKAFLDTFEILGVSREIADLSIAARRSYKLKVPDAIILATAQSIGALLVTRNTKDFSEEAPIVRIPYQTQSENAQPRVSQLE